MPGSSWTVVISASSSPALGPPVGDAHDGLQVGQHERAVPVPQGQHGTSPGPLAAELELVRSTVSWVAGWPSIAGMSACAPLLEPEDLVAPASPGSQDGQVAGVADLEPELAVDERAPGTGPDPG